MKLLIEERENLLSPAQLRQEEDDEKNESDSNVMSLTMI